MLKNKRLSWADTKTKGNRGSGASATNRQTRGSRNLSAKVAQGRGWDSSSLGSPKGLWVGTAACETSRSLIDRREPLDLGQPHLGLLQPSSQDVRAACLVHREEKA